MRVTSRLTGVRIVLIVGAVLGVLAASPGQAWACSCAPRPAASVIDDASAIVVGTPESRSVDGSAVRYRFRVRESHKQKVPQTITVVTASSAAGCGMELRLGAERLLVLGRPPGGVVGADGDRGASLCDNSGVTAADVVRYGGPAIAPYAPNAAREPAPAVVGVFVALAALVALPGAIMWWRVRARDRRRDPD
ncbi:hypothetical protein [Gordonia hankookensis]|uniref:Tissue inhibitor of metalloproteinase n=1 Tax=Gordonia hankookensis TaxID=589403 RepID=A0ABR7WEU5_9ACTN|nr:hypothetical protein [Gordonia hankookensis]MBD1321195.1 hypothetical protein [Gordonia hankookensis]